ncbi:MULTISPECIES: Lrp/AsnC ligand binding domain-containing protein [unclassified Haloparvum]|uniref:Lrp/AsnC ligand binding domain-containing protein n=1 Tax=Haloparvum sp. PAK95 TaxID=3418962 RepID=UPI003D2EC9B3
MVSAYVLVDADVGVATDLQARLRDLDTVTDGHVVAGDWDVILEVTGEEVYDVLSMVTDEIQALDGVVDTKTYVSLEE